MAKVATDRLRLRTDELGWPLDELWVAGALLESVDELDHGSVVLMIDLPTDDLPWLAVHPTAEWIGEQLRLGKRPLSWSYRPTAWPAWTYRDQRVRAVLVGHRGPRPGGHRSAAHRSHAGGDRARPRRTDRSARRRTRGSEDTPSVNPRRLLGPRLATSQPPPCHPREPALASRHRRHRDRGSDHRARALTERPPGSRSTETGSPTCGSMEHGRIHPPLWCGYCRTQDWS